MQRRSAILAAARATAVFASNLSSESTPTADQVDAAIRNAMVRYGGIRGCIGELAEEYGNHPETAPRRMRWARQLVSVVYVNDHPPARRRKCPSTHPSWP